MKKAWLSFSSKECVFGRNLWPDEETTAAVNSSIFSWFFRGMIHSSYFSNSVIIKVSFRHVSGFSVRLAVFVVIMSSRPTSRRSNRAAITISPAPAWMSVCLWSDQRLTKYSRHDEMEGFYKVTHLGRGPSQCWLNWKWKKEGKWMIWKSPTCLGLEPDLSSCSGFIFPSIHNFLSMRHIGKIPLSNAIIFYFISITLQLRYVWNEMTENKSGL